MALPSSGLIKLTDLVAEFGGSGLHGLREYLRNGAYVPTNASTSSIPTSGLLALTHFYGASNTPAVDIVDQSVYASGQTSASGTVLLKLTTSGLQQQQSGTGSLQTIGTWLNSGSASSYQVRLTTTYTNSNGTYTGTYSAWTTISSDQTWTITSYQGYNYQVNLTMEIRRVSDWVVVDTSYISLDSTWENPAVNIVDQYCSAVGMTSGGSTCLIRLTAAGLQQQKAGTASIVTDGTWLNSGSASNYQVRLTTTSTNNSGTYTGTYSSWVSLSSDVTWTITAYYGTNYLVDLTMEVRRVSDSVIVDTSYISLDSQWL